MADAKLPWFWSGDSLMEDHTADHHSVHVLVIGKDGVMPDEQAKAKITAVPDLLAAIIAIRDDELTRAPKYQNAFLLAQANAAIAKATDAA